MGGMLFAPEILDLLHAIVYANTSPQSSGLSHSSLSQPCCVRFTRVSHRIYPWQTSTASGTGARSDVLLARSVLGLHLVDASDELEHQKVQKFRGGLYSTLRAAARHADTAYSRTCGLIVTYRYDLAVRRRQPSRWL